MLAYNFINMDAFTNTPTYRLIAVKGQVWDNIAGELANAPTYADTLITLSEDGVINGVPVKLPAALPAGQYYMMFYDNAAPDNTTAYDRWYMISWNNVSKEMTSIRDMAPHT